MNKAAILLLLAVLVTNLHVIKINNTKEQTSGSAMQSFIHSLMY